MLKKALFFGASFVFALGILAASVYRTSAQFHQALASRQAQAAVVNFKVQPLEVTVDESGETTAQAERKAVDYELTYPGILPDHFLYPLKMIRDRIWLFLTTNPLKKAELLLKFADKRIWSAEMLVEKNKPDLVVSTATKAEKYLERALNQERIAREKGEDTTAFLQRLEKATRKHEEVLLGIREKVADSAKVVIEKTLEYSRRGHQEVVTRLGE